MLTHDKPRLQCDFIGNGAQIYRLQTNPSQPGGPSTEGPADFKDNSQISKHFPITLSFIFELLTEVEEKMIRRIAIVSRCFCVVFMRFFCYSFFNQACL